MAHTRILIFGLQRMMREIIENAILGQPDLEVVSLPERSMPAGTAQPPTDERQLAHMVEESRVDAVITNRDDPELALALLERHPRLKLFAVLAGGRQTFLYELGLRREELGELSAAALLTALRSGRDVRATPPAAPARHQDLRPQFEADPST